MEAKEFKEVKHDSELQSFGDHDEITTVKDSRIMSDNVSCHNEKMAFISHSQKLSVPDCSHYLQTGFCAFGMDCKFNRPSKEENVEGTLEGTDSIQKTLEGTDSIQKTLETCKVGVLGNDASSEIVEQIECKFYLLPGGCKYGDDCIFLHHVQLNFLGLPIRPGEIECPFYITTGGCKFASRCRYHHPDPTVVIEETFFKEYNIEAPSQTSFFDSLSYYDPVLRTSNPDLHSNTEWNGNQSAKTPFRPQEMNINDQLKILANKETRYEFRGGIGSQQFEGYPQRPCEPVCQFFMKNGFCMFKAACRYHHPKSKLSLESLSSNNLHHGFVKQLQVAPVPPENDKIQQTTFLATSASYAPILLTPNQGLKLNEQWIGNQIATSSFHSPETKLTEQWLEIANENTAYEFRGTIDSQQVNEYPQRLNEPECQYFMKTGYCKFKSACKYHHPKSNLCIINQPPRPAISSHQYLEPVEQLCLTQCLSENTLNERTTYQAPSTSFVERQDIPNQQIQSNDECIQNQVDTAPLHLQEKKLNDQGQELSNKYNAFKFNSGVDFQLSDEYPQRPDEPECQYFMKTGYCKFKSACRYHHPYSNLHIPGILLKPLKSNYEGFRQNVQLNGDQMATGSLHVPEIKMNEHGREFANKCVISEFSGCLESQHLDEYPQKPSEPECQYFMKTGHCKFKSACRYHHPKSNFSHLESQIKSMSTNPLHLPELKNDEQGQETGNNDAPYEFNDGGESQQPDEYPQRPSEPKCQYFMKTGFCKFKSACRYHHPQSNPSILKPPEKLKLKQ